jgi:hypothetical protein
VTTALEPALTEIAEVLDRARAHIVRYGYCGKYLYNTSQGTRLPIGQRAVDLRGAITVAVHGTPLNLGRDPLTMAAVQAVEARITAPSIAAWCDYKGNGKQRALDLLRETAGRLRREAS